MPTDLKYVNGDNELRDGNYQTTTGCVSKVARAVRMHQTVIDGEVVGNPGYERLQRAPRTPATMAIWRRALEETLDYFLAQGQIEDLEIEVEAGTGGSVLTRISFTDTLSGEGSEITVPGPWGE